MSDPTTNDPIIEIVIRNDIFRIEQTSLSKVKRILILCTPCLAKTMVNNPGYLHDVTHGHITDAVCELCAAATYVATMRYLEVDAYKLNQLILKRSIHTVTSRGISYRVRRVKFSV